MMDQQSSEPTTPSPIGYASDGSVVMKQEPQNESSQVDAVNDCVLSDNVINIAPFLENQTEVCKIEDVHSVKQETLCNWCKSSESDHQLAVKQENDLDVCDGDQDSKIVNTALNRDVSLKTEMVQTEDSSSQLVEIAGAIDCKDDIIDNVTPDRGNQSDQEQGDEEHGDEEQGDEEQGDELHQPPSDLESTDEIKREGM